MVICYLGVGSNLGNRRKNIKLALEKIRQLKDTKLLKVSKVMESIPLGGPVGQGKFLNAALKIKTGFSPKQLLKQLKIIEKDLGRVPTVRWGPRVIDLDILLYSDRLINTRELVVPHPRILERKFMIKPLLEVI